MNGLILSMALLGTPEVQLDLARNFTLVGDYERSNEILLRINPDRVSYNDYHFYRAVNHFRLNEKEKAEYYIKAVEDSFQPVQQRHKALIYMMADDIKHWKQNDLGDIGRDMAISGDRLQNAKGGKKTQDVQKEIVSKLDRLIKEQEDKENAAAAKAQEKDKQAKAQGQGQNQPAPDSNIMGGKGEGKVDDKKLRQIAENWGTLPPHKRAAIVQELTRELPEKYKPMIEEYFKALNRMDSKK